MVWITIDTILSYSGSQSARTMLRSMALIFCWVSERSSSPSDDDVELLPSFSSSVLLEEELEEEELEEEELEEEELEEEELEETEPEDSLFFFVRVH